MMSRIKFARHIMCCIIGTILTSAQGCLISSFTCEKNYHLTDTEKRNTSLQENWPTVSLTNYSVTSSMPFLYNIMNTTLIYSLVSIGTGGEVWSPRVAVSSCTGVAACSPTGVAACSPTGVAACSTLGRGFRKYLPTNDSARSGYFFLIKLSKHFR